MSLCLVTLIFWYRYRNDNLTLHGILHMTSIGVIIIKVFIKYLWYCIHIFLRKIQGREKRISMIRHFNWPQSNMTSNMLWSTASREVTWQATCGNEWSGRISPVNTPVDGIFHSAKKIRSFVTSRKTSLGFFKLIKFFLFTVPPKSAVLCSKTWVFG